MYLCFSIYKTPNLLINKYSEYITFRDNSEQTDINLGYFFISYTDSTAYLCIENLEYIYSKLSTDINIIVPFDKPY